jgi:hypothetical protein
MDWNISIWLEPHSYWLISDLNRGFDNFLHSRWIDIGSNQYPASNLRGR